MKQTSIEWLVEFFESGVSSREEWTKAKEQAKEMHKQEIEDAYYFGQSLNAKSVTSQMIIDNAMSYYNEIYGDNK